MKTIFEVLLAIAQAKSPRYVGEGSSKLLNRRTGSWEELRNRVNLEDNKRGRERHSESNVCNTP